MLAFLFVIALCDISFYGLPIKISYGYTSLDSHLHARAFSCVRGLFFFLFLLT